MDTILTPEKSFDEWADRQDEFEDMYLTEQFGRFDYSCARVAVNDSQQT